MSLHALCASPVIIGCLVCVCVCVSCPGVGEVLFGLQLSPPAPRMIWDSTHTVGPRSRVKCQPASVLAVL
eukprot:jgi/Chrzof1/11275/Cz05g30080.t1